MISNYVKTSLRNLTKHKQSNFLNIAGLAFALACCALCYMHIQFQLGFDKFNSNFPNIYRLVAGDPGTDEFWVKVAAPMPSFFKEQIPEIEDFARFTSVSYNPKVVVNYEEDSYLESNFMMADPALFKLFSLHALEGDPIKALNDLNTVVITETTSKKLFGNQPAIGKVIRLKDKELDFQVGAVIGDVPEQSHLTFDYLISFENLERVLNRGISNSWGMFNYFAYVKLDPRANPTEVGKKIQAARHTLPDSQEVSFERIFLQPLKNIHFQYNRGNQLPSYDERYLYIFATIAFALLVVACINYINLSIALSIKRIKEIGIRKAIGASQGQLIFQFINEGILAAFIALVAGLFILEAGVPLINMAFGVSLHTNYGDPLFAVFLTGLTLLLGLISGGYLSFYVNGFKASSILKGTMKGDGKGLTLQRTLVFVQFSISIVLIVSSLIISNQMSFLQEKNLGFDHSQVITVPLSSGSSRQKVEELKTQLKQLSQVQQVAASSFVPGTANWNQTVWWEGQTEPVSMFIISVDRDFLRTMDIELVEGDLAQIESNTNEQFILNQSARDFIGWESAHGKLFSPFGQSISQPVAGVIEDFNFMSLHHQIAPLVLVISDRFFLNQMSVRITGTEIQESITSIGDTYKKVMGDTPFEFSFMDETINNLYQAEARVKKIVTALSMIAISFALFGVYGLISFSIENKTKEIAIRKVLGIAPKELVILFSKSYYGLMAIAFVVALPIVWNLMNSWLSNFSYKVKLNPIWFVLAFAGVMLAVAAIGVIKYLSIQKINPARALRSE